MLKNLFLIVAFLLLALMPSAFAAPATFGCEGSLFEPDGTSPSSINATLTTGSPWSIDIGKGPVQASSISNNRIQFKFATKDSTGEYFYYTRDLFLIYKSGHLARLMCSPR